MARPQRGFLVVAAYTDVDQPLVCAVWLNPKWTPALGGCPQRRARVGTSQVWGPGPGSILPGSKGGSEF